MGSNIAKFIPYTNGVWIITFFFRYFTCVMRIGYSFWSFIYLFYNLLSELDLPTVIQINWAWTSFKIIQHWSEIYFFCEILLWFFKNLLQEKLSQAKMWMKIQLVKMLERWTKILKKSRRLFGMKWRKCHHFKRCHPF